MYYDDPYARWYGQGYGVPYGTLTLAQGGPQPQQVEPLTLAQVKQHLRVDFADDDLLISSLITAARSTAEILQNRVLSQRQFDLHFDYWPCGPMALLAPTTSVDLVQYTDPQGVNHALVAGTNYVTDLYKQPARITLPPNTAWPYYGPNAPSSVLVRFTAGYAPTDAFWSNAGARLIVGMLLLISHWYTLRQPVAVGLVGEYPLSVTFNLTQGALRRAI